MAKPANWSDMPLVQRIEWLFSTKGMVSKATAATPPLSVLSSTDVSFTFDQVQPDTDYEIFVDFLGGALGKLSYVEKSKLVNTDAQGKVTGSYGCVLTVTAIVAVSITTGTIRVRAIHT